MDWGLHELDSRWARHLVADAGVGRGDLVLDIGAGHGALTLPLLEAGARVIAIERHPALLAQLRARFGADAVVVAADAADLRLPRRPFHVVANPPFAVTSALLTRLLHPGSRLESAHLVLQVQAAHRWAGPAAPAWRRWRRDFVATVGRRIPRAAFNPPPHVGCCVLELRRLDAAAMRS